MKRLSDENVSFYRQHGYWLYRQPVFSPDKFARLQSIFEEHLADKGDKLSDELDTPHFRDPRLLEFLLADEILDLVEPILGPDILLWSSHFISKEPYTGRETPWHEDSAYWRGRFDSYDRIVTVWLALDPSTRSNGCMRVIPGSHVNGFSHYVPVDPKDHTFGLAIPDVPEESAVDFELQPNQCSLHDPRIIHGAKANTSPQRRCGYTMRFIASSVKVIAENNPGWKIWLARGRDLAGNQYETVG